MKKRRRKPKIRFIHTFFLFLIALGSLTLISININLPSIEQIANAKVQKDKLFNDTTELDDSDEDYSSPDENIVLLGNNIWNKTKNKQFTVVIDPGHGGPDPGSIGPNGSFEKDIALSVALKLGPILQKKGCKVIYTRKTDKLDWSGQKAELLERAAIANNAKADLYVSIHTNSSQLPDSRGTETYYHEASSKGKKLALSVQSEVVKEVKLRNRGVKTEDFSVLRNVNSPSILIELGYISNSTEENTLVNSEYQSKFAQGISNGVFRYLKISN